eukprot:538703_1
MNATTDGKELIVQSDQNSQTSTVKSLQSNIVNQNSQTNIANETKDPDRVVAHLNEDIWSLAFVLIRTGKGLGCCFLIFLVLIWLIQFGSLVAMAYGFHASIYRDVIVPYNVKGCDFPFNDTHNMNDTLLVDVCEELDDLLMNSSVDIIIELSEAEPKKTEYDDHERFESGYMAVFGWASAFSYMLLSIYGFSSITNSITIFVISRRFDEDQTKCFGGCRSYLCGIGGFLRVMSWANVFLTAFAFFIGLWILSFYTFYFGIQNVNDIMLTPIGIVFILELDDWAFVGVRNWYEEANDDDQFALKACEFETNQFRMRMTAVAMGWFILGFVLGACQWYIFSEKLREGASKSVLNAARWQSFAIAGIIILTEAIALGLWVYMRNMGKKRTSKRRCRSCREYFAKPWFVYEKEEV